MNKRYINIIKYMDTLLFYKIIVMLKKTWFKKTAVQGREEAQFKT